MAGKLGPQVAQRDVRLALDSSEDECRLSLDPARATIAALPLGRGVTGRSRHRLPADRARRAHPETSRRLPAGRPLLNRGKHPLTKIN